MHEDLPVNKTSIKQNVNEMLALISCMKFSKI